MVDESTIQQAIKTLLMAAPGARVILFGSYARGEARSDSDLDLLVIEPEVRNRIEEMVRLREVVDEVVRPLLIPVDVLVVSAERFEHWKDTPNTVYFRAAKEGKLYEPAVCRPFAI